MCSGEKPDEKENVLTQLNWQCCLELLINIEPICWNFSIFEYAKSKLLTQLTMQICSHVFDFWCLSFMESSENNLLKSIFFKYLHVYYKIVWKITGLNWYFCLSYFLTLWGKTVDSFFIWDVFSNRHEYIECLKNHKFGRCDFNQRTKDGGIDVPYEDEIHRARDVYAVSSIISSRNILIHSIFKFAFIYNIWVNCKKVVPCPLRTKTGS